MKEFVACLVHAVLTLDDGDCDMIIVALGAETLRRPSRWSRGVTDNGQHLGSIRILS
jgi:hypothetical protein